MQHHFLRPRLARRPLALEAVPDVVDLPRAPPATDDDPTSSATIALPPTSPSIPAPPTPPRGVAIRPRKPTPGPMTRTLHPTMYLIPLPGVLALPLRLLIDVPLALLLPPADPLDPTPSLLALLSQSSSPRCSLHYSSLSSRSPGRSGGRSEELLQGGMRGRGRLRGRGRAGELRRDQKPQVAGRGLGIRLPPSRILFFFFCDNSLLVRNHTCISVVYPFLPLSLFRSLEIQ